MIRELPAGYGFADIVFLPLPSAAGKPVLIIELKYDRSADTTLQQIKDRHYSRSLEDYTGDILLVGVNYDKNSKNKLHSCRIEKIK